MTKILFTIGHSTRALSEFIEILQAYHITQLVDVRTIPKSRKFPWFNESVLKTALAQEKISYTLMPKLGGLRRANKDSINTGWRNDSFRGFADYMQTPVFFEALKELNQLLKQGSKVAIMCAEAVPWRCHRSLIADAERVRHYKIWHIISKTSSREHTLTRFAKVDSDRRPKRVYYPE